MAIAPDPKGTTLKNVTLISSLSSAPSGTEGTQFEKHVSSVTFTPSTSTTTWTGMGNNTWQDTATSTWTLDITYIQDWEQEDSLSAYLFDNEGERATFTFTPVSGSGRAFTTEAVITPGAVGGAVNAVAEATVSLACEKPSHEVL